MDMGPGLPQIDPMNVDSPTARPAQWSNRPKTGRAFAGMTGVGVPHVDTERRAG